jgi:copper homeostasis protein
VLLEVIASSVNDALEAERGGAGRLEVVRELGKGGLTPALELVERIMEVVTIPVRVMIREREGYSAGDAQAVEQLARLAAGFAALGVDGVVMGFLRDRRIDEAAMNTVLAAATPARATFHHAFDDLPDPIATIEALRRWPQIDRVLTSGGAGDWKAKADRIVEWTAAAARRIGMLPGGGVSQEALRILAKAGLAEAHAGRAARVPPTADGGVSSLKVAELVEAARP